MHNHASYCYKYAQKWLFYRKHFCKTGIKLQRYQVVKIRKTEAKSLLNRYNKRISYFLLV